MIDFIFSNGAGGVLFTLRTDALKADQNSFQALCAVDADTATEKGYLSKQLGLLPGQFTLKQLVDFATTNNLNLQSIPRSNSDDALTSQKQFTLGTPGNMAAADGGATTMDITWDAVTNATGYILQRSTANDFSANLVTLVNGANVLTFHDTGLTTATTYYYRVKAVAPGYADSVYATASDATD